MYEFIEKNIDEYTKKITKLFNNSRLRISTGGSDIEKSIRSEIRKLRKKLKDTDEDFFMLLILFILSDLGYNPENKTYILNELNFDLEAFLASYNQTTLYVYKNEVERKTERYSEGLIAIGDMNDPDTMKLMKDNIRYWWKQLEEISVDMERDIVVKEAKHRGFKKMKWVAVGDEKTCKECMRLNGQIFSVDEIPARPHIGCRCILKETE